MKVKFFKVPWNRENVNIMVPYDDEDISTFIERVGTFIIEGDYNNIIRSDEIDINLSVNIEDEIDMTDVKFNYLVINNKGYFVRSYNFMNKRTFKISANQDIISNNINEIMSLKTYVSQGHYFKYEEIEDYFKNYNYNKFVDDEPELINISKTKLKNKSVNIICPEGEEKMWSDFISSIKFAVVFINNTASSDNDLRDFKIVEKDGSEISFGSDIQGEMILKGSSVAIIPLTRGIIGSKKIKFKIYINLDDKFDPTEKEITLDMWGDNIFNLFDNPQTEFIKLIDYNLFIPTEDIFIFENNIDPDNVYYEVRVSVYGNSEFNNTTYSNNEMKTTYYIGTIEGNGNLFIERANFQELAKYNILEESDFEEDKEIYKESIIDYSKYPTLRRPEFSKVIIKQDNFDDFELENFKIIDEKVKIKRYITISDRYIEIFGEVMNDAYLNYNAYINDFYIDNTYDYDYPYYTDQYKTELANKKSSMIARKVSAGAGIGMLPGSFALVKKFTPKMMPVAAIAGVHTIFNSWKEFSHFQDLKHMIDPGKLGNGDFVRNLFASKYKTDKYIIRRELTPKLYENIRYVLDKNGIIINAYINIKDMRNLDIQDWFYIKAPELGEMIPKSKKIQDYISNKFRSGVRLWYNNYMNYRSEDE